MLQWDSIYLKPIKINNIYNEIIEKAFNKSTNNFEEIDEIENEYTNKIEQIKVLYDNEKELEKLLKLTSLELIKEEYNYVKLFSKYSLQQNNYDINFLLKILNILYKISENLRNRIKQPKIVHKFKKDKPIMRCSYKFCNFKSDCKFYYNKKKCNSDHFVHNMISADLDNLIKFFKNKSDKSNTNNKEVIKSINTILYVICHMKGELLDSCRYESKDKWENYHI